MTSRRKIIVTGTGRAGTTFLMRLLTELGAPTGYERDTWQAEYSEAASAGLERDITDPDAPYIVKNPELCRTLPAVLARGDVVIDHAIIPVRDLESATRSRIRIGGHAGERPGGLVGTSDPALQRAVLAERFHELVHTLVAHDIPHTFLQFPRFVQDPAYTFARLAPIFPEFNARDFTAAFQRIADPGMVHDFRPGATPVPAPRAEIARPRRKSSWRHARRAAGWFAITATAAIVGRICLPPLQATPAADPPAYVDLAAEAEPDQSALPRILTQSSRRNPYRHTWRAVRVGSPLFTAGAEPPTLVPQTLVVAAALTPPP